MWSSDRSRHAILLLICAGLLAATVSAQPSRPNPVQPLELNTILMQSTFRIQGVSAAGQLSFGTAFVLGRPIKADSTRGAYVLITAKHLMESFVGETATLNLRTHDPDGTWRRVPKQIPIRTADGPRWAAHPSGDVVAMYVDIPPANAIPLLPTTLLADDQTVARLEIHPGDEVSCLGFPLGAQSNDAGFPVLRSGKVASYPLLPTGKTKWFLMDFAVLPGNSGGPVYLVNNTRAYGNAALNVGVVQAILGLVIEELSVPSSAITTERRFLNLARVVHASLIRETIDMLPEPRTPPPQK
jgi:S1-C subfamily serine protease